MTLQDQFLRYHLENPQVYQLFSQYAKKVRNRGFTRYSANAIFERIRWHYHMEKPTAEPFKMNNNYRAFYARMFMAKNPDMRGFFELREQPTQRKDIYYGIEQRTN